MGLKEGKGQNCWSCLCSFLLVVFYSEYGCKIWCPFCSNTSKRLILNLGCIHFFLPVPILPVCKLILLMSTLSEDLGSRWWGRERLGFDIYWHVKAVASPSKLLFPKTKGYNFQIAFHDHGQCSFSWTSSLFDFNQNLVS